MIFWFALSGLLFSSGVRGMALQSDLHMPPLSQQDSEQEFDFVTFDRNLQESICAPLIRRQHSPSPPISPRRLNSDFQEDIDELYTGPELSLYDAALKHFDSRIEQCLKNGASLQTKDAQDMTLFHHLAQEEMHAATTMFALVTSPRKHIVDTVLKMGLKNKRMYSSMVKWHIAGLLRVFMMQDKFGKTPIEYTKQGPNDEWQCYFMQDSAYLQAQFGQDILFGYINACAGVDY